MKINEVIDYHSEQQTQAIKKFAQLVKKDCQPWLQATDYMKYPLFRGSKHYDTKVMTSKVPLDDRPPRDTSKFLHKIMNDYFINRFGEPFRNSMFVSGNHKIAMAYGTLFIIAPIGQFTYCWSPMVEDFYGPNVWHIREVISDVLPHDLPEEKIPEATEQIYNEIDKLGYKTNGMRAAIRSGYEIMVRCQRFHGLQVGHDSYGPQDVEIADTVQAIRNLL